MSRPVPEAAPLVGVVLAFGFALFGFLFSTDHLATVLGTVALLYPFVAFGVVRSADPTSVFPPDVVLAAGVLGGAPVFLYGVATGRPSFGAFVAAVVAVPPVLYHARYGASVNPLSPAGSLAVGLLAAAGLVAYAVAAGRPLSGAATAAVVGIAAVDYHRTRGGTLAPRLRTAAVVGCLGGGLAAFGALAATGRAPAGLAAGVVLGALGTALALDAEPG